MLKALFVVISKSMSVTKKTILKRTADIFEKFAIGSMLIGVFQGQQLGIIIGLACAVFSYIFSFLEAKQ